MNHRLPSAQWWASWFGYSAEGDAAAAAPTLPAASERQKAFERAAASKAESYSGNTAAPAVEAEMVPPAGAAASSQGAPA